MPNCNRGSRFASVNARIVLRQIVSTNQCSFMFGRLLRLVLFLFLFKLFELSSSLALAEVYFTILKDMKMRFTTLSLRGLRILPRSCGPTLIFTFYKSKAVEGVKGRTMFRHANTVSFSSVSVFKYLWRMKLSSLHGCCKI